MYEFNVTLDLPFDHALQSVQEALAGEKLGIISDVDVQAIFRQKMAKSIRPYRILGVCSPPLADRVISAEPNAGTLLPCNLILRGTDDDKTVVSFMDPVPVLGLSENPEVRAVAAEARDKLQRVIARLA